MHGHAQSVNAMLEGAWPARNWFGRSQANGGEHLAGGWAAALCHRLEPHGAPKILPIVAKAFDASEPWRSAMERALAASMAMLLVLWSVISMARSPGQDNSNSAVQAKPQGALKGKAEL